MSAQVETNNHAGTPPLPEDLRDTLVRQIRAVRPDIVLGHDPTSVFFGQGYVSHHDHRSVGWATLDACTPAAYSPLYFPDAGPAHRVGAVLLSGTLEPDTFVDVEGWLDAKIEALLCHTSQVGDEREVLAEVVRRRAEEAGRQGGLRYAEAYRSVRLT